MNRTGLRDESHRPRTPRGVRPAAGTPGGAAVAGPGIRRRQPRWARPAGPQADRSALPPVLGRARGRPGAERDLRPYRIPRLPTFRVRGYERGGYTAVTRRQRSFRTRASRHATANRAKPPPTRLNGAQPPHWLALLSASAKISMPSVWRHGSLAAWQWRTSVLAHDAGVAGHQERCQRPAQHGRCPGEADPDPALCRVTVWAPEIGLVHVDKRDDRVDRVAERVEAWVMARALCRGRYRAQPVDVSDRHDEGPGR